MRDEKTKDRDELAEKHGITPAAAQSLLNKPALDAARVKAEQEAGKPTKDPNHKDAT